MQIKYQIESFEDILYLYLFQQKYQFYPFYIFFIHPQNIFFEECIHKLFSHSPYQLIDSTHIESFEKNPILQKKDIFDFSLSHSPLFLNNDEYKENNSDMIMIWEKDEIETTYRFMEKYPTDRKVYIYSHLTYDDLEILFWNRECQYIQIPEYITKKEFLERWEKEICKVNRIYSFGYHPLLFFPLLLRDDSFQVCMNQEPQYLSESTIYFKYLLKTFPKWDKKEEIINPPSNPIILSLIEEEVPENPIFQEPENPIFQEDFKEPEKYIQEMIPPHIEPEIIILPKEPIYKMKVLKEKSIKLENEYIFDITEKNIIGLTYIICYQQDKDDKIKKIWIQKNYLMLLNETNRMLYNFFKDWFHLVHPHYVKIEFYQNGTEIKNKLEVEKILIEIGIEEEYQKNFKEILKIPNYYIEYKNYIILDKNINEKLDTQKVIILKNTKEDIVFTQQQGDISILFDHRKYEKYKKMIPFSYMDILHREIELIKNCKKVYYEENSNRYSYNRILFDLFSKRVV